MGSSSSLLCTSNPNNITTSNVNAKSQDKESQDKESQDKESQDKESQDKESQDKESQDKESQDCESSPELPNVIDPAVAIDSIREHTDTLIKALRHCLPSLADSLYSQFIIPEDAQREAQKGSLDVNERSRALLSCVDARLKIEPLDFKKFVNILKAEPFLDTLGSKLVQSYCTLSSAPTTSPAISPVISHYAAYLKRVYMTSPISSDSKWPPTPSKKYIKLATIENNTKCRDEFIGHTLHGNIQEVLKSNKEISMDMILVPDEEGVAYLKLVLIEGAPGIGKSTLAWELCRRWEQGHMEKYSLTVLLRLREKEIQKISSVDEIFRSDQGKDRKVLIKEVIEEVSSKNGKGVLLIFDGFDELPKTLQKKGGFLVDLIGGTILPECTVLVTSRPSATAKLLTICRPQIQKHIEIMGFTKESVEEYANSIFSSEPKKLQEFKDFISASKNPAINSLMYIPLNAAIIVEIYRHRKPDHLLPHTLTEVYTQLCLTILNRHVKSNLPSVEVEINKFKDLPDNLYKDFLKLSEIAYQGIKKQEVIFHTLPSDLVHFGFLDAVSSLYAGGSISYNFLHLTLQEFFAAYHISQLCGDARQTLFREYGSDEHWNVVWRFVAGFTKLEFLEGQLDGDLFVSKNEENKIEMKPFFIQCLFEANKMKIDESKLFESKNIELVLNSQLPLDFYALGNCTANITSEVSITIEGRFLNFFVSGLKRSDSNSNINRLCLTEIYRNDFSYLPLCGIADLALENTYFTPFDLTHLSKFLPSMTSLKRLSITGIQSQLFSLFYCCDKFLRQLSKTNVTSLALPNAVLARSISGLQPLIDSGRGKLEELYIDGSDGIDDTQLLDMVCGPSSLKNLALLRPHSFYSLMKLEINTCLTKLDIKYSGLIAASIDEIFEVIFEIIEHNKTLEHLTLGNFSLPENTNQVRGIVGALDKNRTLESITIIVHISGLEESESISDYIRAHYELNDPRISLKQIH